MLHFKRLRLNGFKSFVDPTTLDIDMGLTGIVGPNGCGKSNLVEALKWVMGETSAKQMRGGEMDDVIFAGSDRRPSRNVAEVVLTLDNATQGGPAQFAEADDLEIARRIEREKGSLYKINGQDMRARDVQLLFADQATGARSTALVSQGRIGAVIAAKPTDRRMLLEEAVGIRGLHSRRHEAELRLRGAENNLERLDDILITLDSQMNALKKQARQATRYKNLSDLIRTAEATLFYIRWTTAESELETFRTLLSEIEKEVTAFALTVTAAGTEQAEAAAEVPALRESEAAAAAALQRLIIAKDGLDEEEQRIAAQTADVQRRIEETVADLTREQTLISDANAAHERLSGEQARIEAAREGEEEARSQAASNLETANDAVGAHEGTISTLTQQVAETEAKRGSLERREQEIDNRHKRLGARLSELREEHGRLSADAPEADALHDAERDITSRQQTAETAEAENQAAEAARLTAQGTLEEARQVMNDARDAATKLEAEKDAISKLLDTGDPDMFPPLIDALGVEPGFEGALGAALGDEIEIPIDEAAPIHWRALPPMADASPLPDGATPLSKWVQAPAALARRLSQIGVVDSVEVAKSLMGQLKAGQRLVTRDGAMCRWDGFTASAGAPTAAARRLEQRNRLREVEAQVSTADQGRRAAETQFEAARTQLEKCNEAERFSREAVRASEAALTEARNILAQIQARMAEHSSKIAAVTDQITTLEADLAEAASQLAETRTERAALPDVAADRAQIDTLRTELAERRTHQMECRAKHDEIERLARERNQRLADIQRELQSWTQRRESSTDRMGELEQRKVELGEMRTALAEKPTELHQRRQALLTEIEGAENVRKDAADKLAAAEARLAEADKALRNAETAHAKAREDKVRAEGSVEQARQNCHAIVERVKDRLECRPDQLFEVSGLDPEKPLPELKPLNAKLRGCFENAKPWVPSTCVPNKKCAN